MKNEFLVGNKIYLRALEQKDLPQWTQWFNDSEVTYFLEHGFQPNTLEMQADRLSAMHRDKYNLQFAIVDKTTDELVGTVGLHQINNVNRNADISIVVGNKKYWGKRLGKEAVSLMVGHAFEKLNLHKVTAGMVSNNKGSFRLFDELGFKKEALFKEHVFVQGKYQDSLKVAIFQKDWKKPKASAKKRLGNG